MIKNRDLNLNRMIDKLNNSSKFIDGFMDVMDFYVYH